MEVIANPGIPAGSIATQPKHLFITMGTLLWLGGGVVVASLSWRWLSRLGLKAFWALLVGVIPVAVWALVVIYDLGFPGFIDELQLRNANLLTLGILIALVGAASLAFVRALGWEGEERDSLLLALGAVGVSVLVLLGVELFFQLDVLAGPRTNTVFKLYHHSWLFMAVGGAFALHYVSSRLEVGRLHRAIRSLSVQVSGLIWAGVAVLLILAGLVYPLIGTLSRTNGFDNAQTLDGLAFTRSLNPSEYEAVRWLNQNVEGTPVILEAVGHPYSEGGRISSRTGLPTVLEWPSHEIAYRGSAEPLAGREADVRQVYETTSVDGVRAILEKYDVEYVYVGPLELQQYGKAGLAKFEQFMKVAFQNPEVTIYRMPETLDLVGTGVAD